MVYYYLNGESRKTNKKAVAKKEKVKINPSIVGKKLHLDFVSLYSFLSWIFARRKKRKKTITIKLIPIPFRKNSSSAFLTNK